VCKYVFQVLGGGGGGVCVDATCIDGMIFLTSADLFSCSGKGGLNLMFW
jgi:hypothetical protein